MRVSNELGAGDFNAAKFAVLVVSITSVSIGVVVMAVVLATRDYFPYLFTSSAAVAKETTKLASLLAVTVLLNSLQPVLSGLPPKKKQNSLTLLVTFIPTTIVYPLMFLFLPVRCCCWSWLASYCGIHQHCMLLHCWITSRNSLGICFQFRS